MQTAADILDLSPVIPIVTLDDPAHAVPLGQALLRGGLRTIEITLRTPAALPAIEQLVAEVPDLVVGAGTIVEHDHARRAAQAGAHYLVTPGCTDRLLDEIENTELPYLGGVSTASEAMRLAERGAKAMKFFPAEASGGVGALKAIAGPLPGLRFCPTGGITEGNAPTYLSLPNVGCVGSSWLAPKNLVASGEWTQVEILAQKAAALR